ncbi:hypothetical protein BR93DRAFT_228770 [Coniochaeta sp. PMI_546]|nr:hypothetical protein BR93DRAFT_228770 [Coniochaeta sp. PMI_546]
MEAAQRNATARSIKVSTHEKVSRSSSPSGWHLCGSGGFFLVRVWSSGPGRRDADCPDHPDPATRRGWLRRQGRVTTSLLRYSTVAPGVWDGKPINAISRQMISRSKQRPCQARVKTVVQQRITCNQMRRNYAETWQQMTCTNAQDNEPSESQSGSDRRRQDGIHGRGGGGALESTLTKKFAKEKETVGFRCRPDHMGTWAPHRPLDCPGALV